jgi:hypothetical protein
MGIRFPLKTVLDYNDAGQTGATSVAGGVAKTFTIPQDTDGIVVKLQASVIAGGVSVYLQTTDDAGTTWYDVARTSVVSNTGLSSGLQRAEWLSVPVAGGGVATGATFATGSIVSMGIGQAGASTLGARQVTGLPILSQTGRVFLQYTAAITSVDIARVKVMVNSQSGTR